MGFEDVDYDLRVFQAGLPLRLRARGPGDPPRVAVPRAAGREADALAGDELRATCARSGRACRSPSSRPSCEWTALRTSCSSRQSADASCYHRIDAAGDRARLRLVRARLAAAADDRSAAARSRSARDEPRPRRVPDRRRPDAGAGGLARPDPRSCRPAGRRSSSTSTTTCTRSRSDPRRPGADRDAAPHVRRGDLRDRVHRRALRALQRDARIVCENGIDLACVRADAGPPHDTVNIGWAGSTLLARRDAALAGADRRRDARPRP